jgi:hypothetical protein
MSQPTANTVTLRYLAISREICHQTAYLSQDVRDRIAAAAMERLGVAVPAGVRPIEAWLTAMAVANDLLDMRPVHADLLDAIMADPDAWSFFYALI